jgi:hypothetical protein
MAAKSKTTKAPSRRPRLRSSHSPSGPTTGVQLAGRLVADPTSSTRRPGRRSVGCGSRPTTRRSRSSTT